MSLNISPEEFTLLTHPNVLFSLPPSAPVSVNLKLSCVSFPIPDQPSGTLPTSPIAATSKDATPSVPPAAPPAKDVILLLRLGRALETPLFAGQRVTYDKQKRTFGFHDAGDVFEITFPAPPPLPSLKKESNPVAALFVREEEEKNGHEDGAETFEVLLRDYGLRIAPISTPAPPPELDESVPDEPPPEYTLPDDPRGHLFLVDNTTGQVLGSLGSPLDLEITESEAMGSASSSQAVVITLPPTPGEGSSSTATAETTVRPASQLEEETAHEADDLIPGTELVAQILKKGTSLLAYTFSSASRYYITHVPPSATGPMHLSQETQITIQRVHAFSNGAVRVSAKTSQIINGFIDRSILTVGNAANSLRKPPDPSAPVTPPTQVQQVASQAGRILGRVITSADRLLTAVTASTSELIEAGTEELSRSLEHRYGAEIGGATRLLGKSARNVGVVYVDARGIGRRALLKRAGQEAVKLGMQKRKSMDQARTHVTVEKRRSLLVPDAPSTSAAALAAAPDIKQSGSPPSEKDLISLEDDLQKLDLQEKMDLKKKMD